MSIEKRIYDSLHQKSEEALASAQMSSLILVCPSSRILIKLTSTLISDDTC